MLFDESKKYNLSILRNDRELFFTATKVRVVGALICFQDKFGKQLVFPLDALKQADEVRG